MSIDWMNSLIALAFVTVWVFIAQVSLVKQ